MQEKPSPLRLVTEADTEEAPRPKPTTRATLAPAKDGEALSVLVRETDATQPENAERLARAGKRVADSAVDYFHSAQAHAPAGTFHREVPPGMKSAEATKVWLSTHQPKAEQVYPRGGELREAVLVAITELDRATDAADQAGLNFIERRDEVLRSAIGILQEEPESVEVSGEVAPAPKYFRAYWSGLDALSALWCSR